jgi:hypothetical protein
LHSLTSNSFLFKNSLTNGKQGIITRTNMHDCATVPRRGSFDLSSWVDMP